MRRTSSFQAVLFDVDDTLYSVTELMTARWRQEHQQLSEVGINAHQLADAYQDIHATLAYKDLLTGVLRHLGHDANHAGLLHSIAYNSVPVTLTPYPGVVKALIALRTRGVKIGFLSNGTIERQSEKIVSLGLDGLYDELIICDGKAAAFKPEPAAFVYACELLGSRPEETCMVGDRTDNDLLPAIKLGMGSVRLRLGNHHEQPTPDGVDLETTCPLTAWQFLLANSGPNAISIPTQGSKHQLVH